MSTPTRTRAAAAVDRVIRSHSPALADDIQAHQKADALGASLTSAFARRAV